MLGDAGFEREQAAKHQMAGGAGNDRQQVAQSVPIRRGQRCRRLK